MDEQTNRIVSAFELNEMLGQERNEAARLLGQPEFLLAESAVVAQLLADTRGLPDSAADRLKVLCSLGLALKPLPLRQMMQLVEQTEAAVLRLVHKDGLELAMGQLTPMLARNDCMLDALHTTGHGRAFLPTDAGLLIGIKRCFANPMFPPIGASAAVDAFTSYYLGSRQDMKIGALKTSWLRQVVQHLIPFSTDKTPPLPSRRQLQQAEGIISFDAVTRVAKRPRLG